MANHMTRVRAGCRIAALLVAMLAGGAPMLAIATESATPSTAPSAAASSDDLVLARARYERGEWAAALEPLERAAGAGDRRAQEMAGFMRWLGPALYGPAVLRDREAALRWFDRAAAGGSDVGRLMAACIRTPTCAPEADARGAVKEVPAG